MENFDEENYIYDLISEGEHQQLDFKFEITNARKIAKTLVAFANTDGGRLLIGVKDNGRIAGVRTAEEYYMIEAAASVYCKPEIEFESFNRKISGKTVLEIVINPSVKKPHLAKDDSGKWLAYHRVMDENQLADYILLNVWRRATRKKGTFIKYTEREQELLEYISKTGSVTLTELVRHFRWKKRHIQNMLVNLVAFKVLTIDFNEKEAQFEIINEQE
ncbi:MAG TPA: ATP-binding protein [Bacteroidales bacterium]|nr:ATP-binding protein [Bacteroidales bacterium]